MNESMSKYKDIKSQIRKAAEVAKIVTQSVFEGGAKELFEVYPVLTQFRWYQYTPYYNDGDACIFGAQTDYIYLNDEEDEFSKWDAEDSNQELSPELRAAGAAVLEFLKVFDDDDYESLFGDHCQVTVTRAGITVEEYEHE